MHKYLLTIVGLFFLLKISAQTFYANMVIDYPVENKTFQLNVMNCDTPKIYSCPPTNNILQYPENVYTDIAIDTNQNIYYVSGWGSLYTRKLNDTSSCRFLGTFDNSNSINALVTDVKGTVFAAGNHDNISTLYKYEPLTNIFSIIGNFPPDFFSSGDLFFYEGKLFLTATNSNLTNSFLVDVNLSNTSQSCYYMNLQNLHPWGAFSIKYNSYSKAYIISSDYLSANNYTSTLFEIDLTSRTIGQLICVYPFDITGAATIYNFVPSVIDGNSCTTLPIQLLKFEYSLNNKSVELLWETVTEVNNNYFLIEKSLNGNNFETIGKQTGAINSNTLKRYSFIDNNPSYINYYRLKQVDIDGKSKNSNVLFVKVPQTKPFKIIQNPVNEVMQIQVNVEQAKINLLTVFDFSGRKLKSFKGQNGIQNLDVSFIAPGTYILQLLTTNGQTYNEHFIKNRY
jgi:hypothetical protein